MSEAVGSTLNFLRFLDLQLFVDQFVDHLLPGWRLVGRQEVQLGALLDIEIGDGLAVDHDRDGLRRDGVARRIKASAAASADRRRDATKSVSRLVVMVVCRSIQFDVREPASAVTVPTSKRYGNRRRCPLLSMCASVRRPICSMKAWLSMGGVVPAA